MTNYNNFLNEFEAFCKAHTFNVDSYGFGIVSHPLFNMAFYMDKEGNLKKITHKNFDEVVNYLFDETKKFLEKFKDEEKFEYLILRVNKPYRLEVFTMFQHLLEPKQYNEILNTIWLSTEFPHQMSNTRLNMLFKRIDKKLFMSKEDYSTYKKLPKNITIYRGLQGKKAKIKALSWSLSFEKASWFGNRFKQEGKVYTTTINKKDIYAYIDSRGEQEIIVNPHMLKEIVEVK